MTALGIIICILTASHLFIAYIWNILCFPNHTTYICICLLSLVGGVIIMSNKRIHEMKCMHKVRKVLKWMETKKRGITHTHFQYLQFPHASHVVPLMGYFHPVYITFGKPACYTYWSGGCLSPCRRLRLRFRVQKMCTNVEM